MESKKTENPLSSAPIPGLMLKFAVPSIIAMLVSSLYNIVDQLFIGQAVGTLGNAATNIAFPLSMFCTALALLFGIGGASNFNLAMGRRQTDDAAYYVGNSVMMLAFSGLALCLVTEVFLHPMLLFFGSPSEVLSYAKEYVRITAVGFPFLLLTIGGGHLIRADGSPRMTMFCNLSGAVINTVLDAVFVMGLRWGMSGAALATILGQIFSGILALCYIRHYKTVPVRREHLRIHAKYTLRVMSLGAAACFNQLAMMVVQIVLNNSLKHYGGLSNVGDTIPLACAGIVTKVNMLFMSFVIGLSQGGQPVWSYNYGAENYARVRRSYKLTITVGGGIAVFFFLLFQLFPRQLLSLFGNGTEEYFAFGTSYFRMFLFFTWLNFLQPISSNLFTSIGKPKKGIFLSLTRQIIYLLPLIAVLPLLLGLDGILFAGPAADLLAALTTIVMVRNEFRSMRTLEQAKTC